MPAASLHKPAPSFAWPGDSAQLRNRNSERHYMRNLVFTVGRRKILTAAAGEFHLQHMPATILIADDHDSSRAGLEGLLSLEGYQVVTAGDGEMALIEFRRTKPDLLLLDINMPKMCGTDVCRRIKNDPETRLVPVVLVTALTATEDRIRGIDAGADDFVTKPVEREQLIARVRSLLRQKAFTDELERAESVLFALALSIEGKDSYTQGHCERLSEYSARLGEHLGLPAAEIKALRRAGVV